MAARAARLARTAARTTRIARPDIPPAAVEAHAAAVARGLQTYDDPTTGYTVFTELAHRARGGCCGRMCRHCCYGWRNVRGFSTEKTTDNVRAFATEKPTRASRVYTRKGDGGRARLVGSRDAETPKFATVYEAVGDVDELGVKLGIAAFHTTVEEGGVDVRSRLLKTQALLLDAGATLTVVDRSGDGAYASAARDAFDDAEIAALEEEVDALDAALPPLKNFVDSVLAPHQRQAFLTPSTLEDASSPPHRFRAKKRTKTAIMSLTDLPEELVPLIAKYLPRNDLLALRQCNKSSSAAVHRSIQTDDRFAKMIFDALAEPRNIEAEGRIFGSGARELVSFCAADAALPALQSTITETAGGLQKLCLYRCAVTDARLLEMCRACPLLQTLVCVIDVPNIETADVEDLSTKISQACPLLEVVKLPCNGSAVESYAAAFPNLRCLEFFSHGHGSHVIPSRFDRIERALHTCTNADQIDLDFCVVSLALVEWLLASPLPGRLVALRMGRTAISPDLILELVRACPALVELALPSLMCLGRPFYEALHATRPTLERISLPHCGNDGDECFRVLASFGLAELNVASMDALTPAVVDVVLKGRCAASLRAANLSCVPALGAAEVLKLVKGCPALRTVAWELAGEGGGWGRVTADDEGNLRALIALLETRGGGLESSESGVGRLLHPEDYSSEEDYEDEDADDASGDTTVR